MSQPVQQRKEASADPDRAPERQPGGDVGDSGSDTEIGTAEIRSALVGGAVVAATLFLVVWSVGEAGDAEARILLESTSPSIRFLASSLLTVGATILALMLTLLGISQSTEWTFRRIHYQRIRRLSLMNVVAIVGAVLLLLSMSVPLQESERLAPFYSTIYYAMLGVSSLLGGLVVAIVLMLHRTIKGLSTASSPVDRTGPLIREDEQ